MLVLVAALLIAPQLPDSEVLSDEKLIDFVIRGIKNEREQLRSGIFEAHGRVVHENQTFGHFEGEVELICAFDYDADWFRFDRSEDVLDSSPGRDALQASSESHPRSKTDTGVSYPKRKMGGKYARTPTSTVEYLAGDQSAVAKPVGTAPAGSIRPFDVRVVGLCTLGGLELNTGFDKWYKSCEAHKPESAVAEGNGIYRLTWFYENRSIKAINWISEKEAFSPVRFEMYQYGVLPDGSTGTTEPSHESVVTWKKVSGVFVPEKFTAVFRGQPGHLDSYELAVEWKSVNQVVPEILFTREGFELKKGT